MADERWVQMNKDGKLVLVTELDGWAYMRARAAGNPYRWETPTTLEELAAQWGGTTSRLYQQALAVLEKQGKPHA